MKRLLSLLSAVLLLNSSMVGTDKEPKKDIFADVSEQTMDEVVLDQDIKPVLIHALFSKYLAVLASRPTAGHAIPKPLSNVNREDFKRFSNTFEVPLSELVRKCQKHSASFDVMGTPFSCHSLEEFLVMTEQKPSVLEVNDWWSFLFGGYSKEVQLSSQACVKLRRLRQNITDADSVMGEAKKRIKELQELKKASK